jgi:hypothetical protein
MLKSKEAAIARLLNLLLMRKGTCRDIYDMGCDIKSYLFERADSNLEGKITREVQKQLDNYYQDYYNITFTAELVDEQGTSSKSLLLNFNVNDILDEEGDNTIQVKLGLNKNITKSSDIEVFLTKTY